MKMIIRILGVIFLILPLSLFAITDLYYFNSPKQQERFVTLTTELRCLVCQNQNIAESNAPLAADLRAEIYSRIQQGKSNKEIIHYLVARYGNFILYRPPVNFATLGLWLAPFLFLLIGIGYLFYYTQKSTRGGGDV